MLISWGPDYTMLYNDAYGVVIGNKHPAALGCSCREVLSEAWDFIGPLFDKVYTEGSYTSTLTSQLFTIYRNNYLEECYFAFSYSPIPDDDGRVGGVLTTVLDMTERVIEDRRRQVLRDLASRTAEARHEEEVWRVSAETLGQHRPTVPFAFLYEYRAVENQARLASVSAEINDGTSEASRHSQRIWRFRTTSRRIASWWNWVSAHRRWPSGWPLPAQQATVLPSAGIAKRRVPGAGNPPGARVRRRHQFVRPIADNRHWVSARAQTGASAGGGFGEIDRAKTAFFSIGHSYAALA
jgi:hypothetical protein